MEIKKILQSLCIIGTIFCASLFILFISNIRQESIDIQNIIKDIDVPNTSIYVLYKRQSINYNNNLLLINVEYLNVTSMQYHYIRFIYNPDTKECIFKNKEIWEI